MNENLVDECRDKWCVYCKNPIEADQPYTTIETYDGRIYYHIHCYFLLYPPEEYKELDFGN